MNYRSPSLFFRRCFCTTAFLLVIALSMSGCGGGRPLMVPPSALATKIARHYDDSIFCHVHFPFASLSTYGIPSDRVTPPYPEDEIAVGFENFFNRGADPFSCSQQWGFTYTGAIKFDMEDPLVTAFLETGPVVSARLSLERISTGFPITVTHSRPSETWTEPRCSFELNIAEQPWEPSVQSGNRGGGGLDILTVPPSGSRLFVQNEDSISRTGMGITNLVNEWINGERPNNGIVIVPPAQYVYQQNNDSCTAFYVPTLELTFGP